MQQLMQEQKKLWDERGKGYYGEFLVFTELYKNIKGNCKILMNLEVPTDNGKTTEIDLIMIHENGIYVFEIKHYKGIEKHYFLAVYRKFLVTLQRYTRQNQL